MVCEVAMRRRASEYDSLYKRKHKHMIDTRCCSPESRNDDSEIAMRSEQQRGEKRKRNERSKSKRKMTVKRKIETKLRNR